MKNLEKNLKNLEKVVFSLENEKQQTDKLPEVSFLHQHLDKFPLEQPSTDFTALLMKKIAVLQYKIAYKPLISKKVLALIAIAFITLLGYFWASPSSQSSYIESIKDYISLPISLPTLNIYNWFGGISASWVGIVSILVANIFFIRWLDKRLKVFLQK
jgi:hypothetical protein